MDIKENFSLKNFNSLKIDAKAKYFVVVNSINEIIKLISQKIFEKNNFIILGGGTNILFTKDFDGIVIKNNICNSLNFKNLETKIEILADSGIIFDELIQKEIEFQNNLKFRNNLKSQNNFKINVFGLENLAKIPGNVGSAVVQNIGAYGVEQKDFFNYCKAINLISGEIKTFYKENCDFDYRFSIFKQENNPFFITEVCYMLDKLNKPNIEYPDLTKIFNNLVNKIEISPKNIYNELEKIRKNKLPDVEKFPNVGSYFKNPIIEKKQFDELKSNFSDIKYFNSENNFIKISAAWLIENCNLKGKKIKNVGIFDKHSLIIVNYGEATGQEVVYFSGFIIQEVEKKFGIKLEPEVVYI